MHRPEFMCARNTKPISIGFVLRGYQLGKVDDNLCSWLHDTRLGKEEFELEAGTLHKHWLRAVSERGCRKFLLRV